MDHMKMSGGTDGPHEDVRRDRWRCQEGQMDHMKMSGGTDGSHDEDVRRDRWIT